MHVVVCSSKDIKGAIAANLVHQHLVNTEHTLSIVLADDAPTTDGKKLAAAMCGHHECSYWMNEAFPAIDNKAQVGPTPTSFKTWAQLEAAGVRVITLTPGKSINWKDNFALVKSIQPDVIFSARFLHIFKEEIIKVPAYGILNMHPGALPKYRGLYVDMRAMQAGEECCTMTMHRVPDTGIDTGPIIDTAEVKVEDQSLFGMRLDLQFAGMKMFLKELDRMAALTPEQYKAEGTVESDYETSSDGSHEEQYFTWPTKEEYDSFADAGFKYTCKKDMERVHALFEPSVAPLP